MQKATTDNAFSLLYIFQTIRKYLLYIGGVVLLACILAFVFTIPYFYPPEFEASTIIYPNSAERADLDNLFHKEPKQYVYGSGKEAEKLVNIASSRTLKFEVIDSLDLWTVYDINKDDPDAYPKHYVLQTFDSYVSIGRAAGDGVEIVALDVDPQRAADIVNLVAYKINEHNREMLNRNKESIINLYKSGQTKLEQRLTLLQDSVRIIRKEYNILRSLTQTEVMVEQIMIAQGELADAQGRLSNATNRYGGSSVQAKAIKGEVAGYQTKVRALTTDDRGTAINLEKFREGIDQVMSLEEQIETMAEELAFTRRKIEYQETMDRVPFSTIMTPDPAIPTDKKARPIRWLIMAMTFLISSVVMILGTVLIDQITRTSDKLEA